MGSGLGDPHSGAGGGLLADHESARGWAGPCDCGVGPAVPLALDSPASCRPDDDHPGRADDMPLTIDDRLDEPCRVTTCSPPRCRDGTAVADGDDFGDYRWVTPVRAADMLGISAWSCSVIDTGELPAHRIADELKLLADDVRQRATRGPKAGRHRDPSR